MSISTRDRVLMVLSFVAIHTVWGSTYLGIRYAVETIPPLLTAGLRHLIGGGALFLWCWSRGMRPTRGQWRASFILSIMFFLVGHGTLHWAETVVPSGVAALIVSTEPVWLAAFLAIGGIGRRLSPYGAAGLIAGIAAVAMLVEPPSTIGRTLFIGSVAVLFGTMSWSLGMAYSTRASLHPTPIMSAAMTLLCGGMLLVTASALTGSLAHFRVANVSARSAAALTYLIIFGSLTFAGYAWLLTRVSPVLVATHAYTNPILAVLLGALLAGERVTMRIIAAGVAVLFAIVLVRHDERRASNPRREGRGEGRDGRASRADLESTPAS